MEARDGEARDGHLQGGGGRMGTGAHVCIGTGTRAWVEEAGSVPEGEAERPLVEGVPVLL